MKETSSHGGKLECDMTRCHVCKENGPHGPLSLILVFDKTTRSFGLTRLAILLDGEKVDLAHGFGMVHDHGATREFDTMEGA